MTLAANAFTSYSAKGIREDLSDFIYDVSPTETPFLSNAKRGSIDNTLFEWQTDTLAAAVTTNQQLEGDVVSGAVAATTASVRLGNYAEIAFKSFGVTGTEQRVKKAGRQDEIGYQGARKIKELKRDMESSLLANKPGVAGNATTARQSCAVIPWIKTNVDKASDGTNPAWTSGVPLTARTDGTARSFTEPLLKNAVQLGFTNGMEIEGSMLLVGAANKQVASGFAGIATRTLPIREVAPTAIIGAADVYVSDFGKFVIVPDRFQRSKDAILVDFSYVSVEYLRQFLPIELAKRGDAEERMVLAEYGLRVGNEKALALVTDLS
jgi:uncharacterized protein DUF5309